MKVRNLQVNKVPIDRVQAIVESLDEFSVTLGPAYDTMANGANPMTTATTTQRKKHKKGSQHNKRAQVTTSVLNFMKESGRNEFHCDDFRALAPSLNIQPQSLSAYLSKIKDDGFIRSTRKGYYAVA